MDVAQALHGSTAKKHDVPVNHLDFGYIRECSDVKHLEKILRVLRSKEEGFYPQLETHCEERLTELHPNSRLLRKESPLYSKGDLGKQEKEELDQDLKNWTAEMKDFDSGTSDQVIDMDNDDDDLPPIRSGNIVLTAEGAKSNKQQTTNPKKKPMPREYRDWDKINVEEELKKVDEPDAKIKERTFIANKEVTNIPDKVDTKGLSESERLVKADREKDKGNEAFRANDFKEAVTYYSRSISIQPTAASYNNRALAYLKMTEWQKAITDTNTVLKLEPDNVKALLRRGTAYKGLKQLQKAKVDIAEGLRLDPNNKKAKELLEQIEKDRVEKKKTGRRMVIQDVDEEEGTNSTEESSSTLESSNLEGKPKGGNLESESSEKFTEKSARRVKIVEVESDSEDESEPGTTGGDVLVNGHVTQELSEDQPKCETNEQSEKIDKQQSEEMPEVKTDKKTEAVQKKAVNVDVKKESDVEVKEYERRDVTNSESVDRSSPVSAEEDKSGSSEVQSSEENDSSGSEGSEPAEHFKRPVFYIKELSSKAAAIKEEATKLFKSGQYGEAGQKYTGIINLLQNDESQVVNLSLMYSNRAACHLKTGDLPGTVKDCNASLQLIPHSVKPLLRRAIAYEHLERFKPAYVDYRHVLLIDSWMEQAHQGIKRCQHVLSDKDGPRWREKIHIVKVSPFQIPDIIGLDGKSTTPVVFNNTSTVNQSQPPCSNTSSQSEASTVSHNQSDSTNTSNSQSESRCTNDSQSEVSQSKSVSSPSNVSTIESKQNENKAENKQKTLSPQEQFDKFKSEGNELVKQGKFKDAIEYYSKCEAVLPSQVAIYTNRALCYIRTNQAKLAEEDCSNALNIEKENVKALFRRAQARKMMKQYRDGIEDLKHLLEVDPRNTAAKKEMELVKNYWREELESLKKNIETMKSKQEDLKSQTSRQSNTQSTTKSSSETGSKTGSQSGKQRKRMVIQEVDSEEENKPKGATKTSEKDTKPKVEVLRSDPSKQKSETKPSKESKGNSKPVKETTGSSKGNSQTGLSKKESKTSQKSKIKETSRGLPSAPQTAPKLDKATPYEFISAWNALKKSETVKPYYDLLKQIKPSDIKTVISNKLDGPMLNVIIRCVADHYLPNGEADVSYQLLQNLSSVPRFGTVSMFMSPKEKSEVVSAFNRLESCPSKLYSQTDITELRKLYSV